MKILKYLAALALPIAAVRLGANELPERPAQPTGPASFVQVGNKGFVTPEENQERRDRNNQAVQALEGAKDEYLAKVAVLPAEIHQHFLDTFQGRESGNFDRISNLNDSISAVKEQWAVNKSTMNSLLSPLDQNITDVVAKFKTKNQDTAHFFDEILPNEMSIETERSNFENTKSADDKTRRARINSFKVSNEGERQSYALMISALGESIQNGTQNATSGITDDNAALQSRANALRTKLDELAHSEIERVKLSGDELYHVWKAKVEKLTDNPGSGSLPSPSTHTYTRGLNQAQDQGAQALAKYQADANEMYREGGRLDRRTGGSLRSMKSSVEDLLGTFETSSEAAAVKVEKRINDNKKEEERNIIGSTRLFDRMVRDTKNKVESAEHQLVREENEVSALTTAYQNVLELLNSTESKYQSYVGNERDRVKDQLDSIREMGQSAIDKNFSNQLETLRYGIADKYDGLVLDSAAQVRNATDGFGQQMEELLESLDQLFQKTQEAEADMNAAKSNLQAFKSSNELLNKGETDIGSVEEDLGSSARGMKSSATMSENTQRQKLLVDVIQKNQADVDLKIETARGNFQRYEENMKRKIERDQESESTSVNRLAEKQDARVAAQISAAQQAEISLNNSGVEFANYHDFISSVPDETEKEEQLLEAQMGEVEGNQTSYEATMQMEANQQKEYVVGNLTAAAGEAEEDGLIASDDSDHWINATLKRTQDGLKRVNSREESIRDEVNDKEDELKNGADDLNRASETEDDQIKNFVDQTSGIRTSLTRNVSGVIDTARGQASQLQRDVDDSLSIATQKAQADGRQLIFDFEEKTNAAGSLLRNVGTNHSTEVSLESQKIEDEARQKIKDGFAAVAAAEADMDFAANKGESSVAQAIEAQTQASNAYRDAVSAKADLDAKKNTLSNALVSDAQDSGVRIRELLQEGREAFRTELADIKRAGEQSKLESKALEYRIGTLEDAENTRLRSILHGTEYATEEGRREMKRQATGALQLIAREGGEVSHDALKEEGEMNAKESKIRMRAHRFARWAANMLVAIKRNENTAAERLADAGRQQGLIVKELASNASMLLANTDLESTASQAELYSGELQKKITYALEETEKVHQTVNSTIRRSALELGPFTRSFDLLESESRGKSLDSDRAYQDGEEEIRALLNGLNDTLDDFRTYVRNRSAQLHELKGSASGEAQAALSLAKYGDNSSFMDLVSSLNQQMNLEDSLVGQVWNDVVPRQQGWRNLIRDIMGKLDIQQQTLFVSNAGAESNLEADIEENISSQFVNLEEMLYKSIESRGGDADGVRNTVSQQVQNLLDIEHDEDENRTRGMKKEVYENHQKVREFIQDANQLTSSIYRTANSAMTVNGTLQGFIGMVKARLDAAVERLRKPRETTSGGFSVSGAGQSLQELTQQIQQESAMQNRPSSLAETMAVETEDDPTLAEDLQTLKAEAARRGRAGAFRGSQHF